MARKPKAKGPTPVEATKHKEQRVNIPTQELRQFVEEAEEKPSTLLYPRDPSLDPQLVWKGKDEQDRADLAVPAVPVYIQEKIHPQALIENLRDTAKAGEPEPEQLLFADFNGLDRDFERKIDFYSYDLGSQPKWSNRMILGDSLLVMASLAEKGKVQMIYLDPETFPGRWIQAAGEYTDAGGTVRRVAVSIGPEHGTVGPRQIQEAAKEAVRGIPFDLLLVLGFAFDAHAAETARDISPEGLKIEEGFIAEREAQFGKLPVLLVRMNPDLAMGDVLLKKTGAGNLFMVFGEPDVTIEPGADGKLTVEIRGVDVYDPTTGVIRSSSTDDIACWFLDIDYDEESFFVRHAYFCGAELDEAYDRLKRALRAEVDEAAWASLYTTRSRPFAPPASGKIAVKVINHYGDEVLRVYAVAASTVAAGAIG